MYSRDDAKAVMTAGNLCFYRTTKGTQEFIFLRMAINPGLDAGINDEKYFF